VEDGQGANHTGGVEGSASHATTWAGIQGSGSGKGGQSADASVVACKKGSSSVCTLEECRCHAACEQACLDLLIACFETPLSPTQGFCGYARAA
jgi:hypothetical protein